MDPIVCPSCGLESHPSRWAHSSGVWLPRERLGNRTDCDYVSVSCIFKGSPWSLEKESSGKVTLCPQENNSQNTSICQLQSRNKWTGRSSFRGNSIQIQITCWNFGGKFLAYFRGIRENQKGWEVVYLPCSISLPSLFVWNMWILPCESF